MVKLTRDQKGFSLVEVLVGAVIMAIAILSASFSILNIQQLSEVSKQKVVATADANRVLEAMRYEANVSLTDMQNKNWAVWATDNVINTKGGSDIQLVGENVNVVLNGTDPVQVTLTVNWTHRQRPHSYQVVTLMTQRG